MKTLKTLAQITYNKGKSNEKNVLGLVQVKAGYKNIPCVSFDSCFGGWAAKDLSNMTGNVLMLDGDSSSYCNNMQEIAQELKGL